MRAGSGLAGSALARTGGAGGAAAGVSEAGGAALKWPALRGSGRRRRRVEEARVRAGAAGLGSPLGRSDPRQPTRTLLTRVVRLSADAAVPGSISTYLILTPTPRRRTPKPSRVTSEARARRERGACAISAARSAAKPWTLGRTDLRRPRARRQPRGVGEQLESGLRPPGDRSAAACASGRATRRSGAAGAPGAAADRLDRHRARSRPGVPSGHGLDLRQEATAVGVLEVQDRVERPVEVVGEGGAGRLPRADPQETAGVVPPIDRPRFRSGRSRTGARRLGSSPPPPPLRRC